MGTSWRLSRSSQLIFEFLGNLHNLPGFQEPVGKEVVVTEGREARVIEGTASSLYAGRLTQQHWP